MKSKVLADLTGMVTNRAKTPVETRAKLTELDQRIKMFEDVYDKKGDEEQYKGILLGVMDDETRRQTAMNHEQTFQELKRTILQYINATTGGGDPMQLDRMQAMGGGEGEGKGLDALTGKRGPDGGCWICGGNHHASECPRNKGGGTGKGKKVE